MTRLMNLTILSLALAGGTWATLSAQAVQGPPAAQTPRPPVVIGPPAPVPPEVAMLRPTQAELEQVNAALTKMAAEKAANHKL